MKNIVDPKQGGEVSCHTQDEKTPVTGGWDTLASNLRVLNALPSGSMIKIDKWPPSVNTMYRGKNSTIYLKKEVKQWYAEQVEKVKAQYEGKVIITMPCRIWIDLYAPSDGRKARFDIDNKAKPLLDVLKHANVIQDDVLVDELRLKKWLCPPAIKREGYVEISIAEF